MKVKALVTMCFDDFTNLSKGQVAEMNTRKAKSLQKCGLVEIILEEKKTTNKKDAEEVEL